MEMKIPRKFKEILDQNSALSGLVNTSINEFGEWLKQNNVKLFSEYTDHSLEHIENVLATAHDLIRDECKAFITPHDVATLILAVLLHDSAMHLSEDGFANLIKEDSLAIINGFEDKPWNRLWADFLAEARRFSGRKLIALFGEADPVRHPPLDDLQQLNGKDLLLCGEFLRRHHSRLAHEIALFGVPGPSGRILKLPTTEDTSHVVDLAGLIARSHGLSLRDCFEYLQTQYSSIKMIRGVHPTFLMALLRIADILQIQSSRAPKQVQKVRQIKSSVSSGEWEMHQAIKDVSSKEYPETIWVVAKPENVKTYLRIRNLLDQIQSELDSSWTVIGEVYGYDPEFREFGLKIRRIRSNIDDVDLFSKQVPYIPIHASFDVADTDLLKLLIGPLYGEKAEIGIRELMQNSIDAVVELREYEKQFKDATEESASLIKQEDIVISIDKDEKGIWWFTINDQGIGMTVNTVKEYFLKAGASLRRSEIWKKTFEDTDGKSKILRSGRFGIGALAAFLVGDEIYVSTCHVSNRNNGIEFHAEIDTESIEIKSIERQIGTTIRIKMKQIAIEELIHVPTESKAKTKEKNKKWDWFCLDSPVIVRRVNQLNYSQEFNLPQLKSQLPLGWHRLDTSKFEEVHWSYLYNLPQLVCNGIVVRPDNDYQTSTLSSRRLEDKFIRFRKPNLSVFDFNANFPLNIQRTDITTQQLPFQDSLLESVIRDFIAFTLVEAPVNKSPSETRNELYFKPEYYGGIQDTKIKYYSSIDIPFWISTSEGTGIFCDPTLFGYLDKKSALVIFNYDNESSTPEFKINNHIATLWVPLPKFQGRATNFMNAIAAGLGYSLMRYSPDEVISIQLKPYGQIINSARVLISKKIIEAFNNIRKHSSIEYDILQDVNDFNLVTLSIDDLENFIYKDFKSKKFEYTKKINKEWEDENWVLFSVGICPSPEFDFEEFTKNNAISDINSWPSIIAEWYFEDSTGTIEKSKFSSLWDDLIRNPVIPYDLTERKNKLSYAFQELEADIENYLATKELVEKELKQNREEE